MRLGTVASFKTCNEISSREQKRQDQMFSEDSPWQRRARDWTTGLPSCWRTSHRTCSHSYVILTWILPTTSPNACCARWRYTARMSKTGNCRRDDHVRHHNVMSAYVGQSGVEPVRKDVRNVPDDLTYYGSCSGIYMPRSRNFFVFLSDAYVD